MILGERIGIIGGSFDPPHLGHLHCGIICQQTYALDSLIYLCANRSPFKKKTITSWQHRVKMVDVMLREHPNISVSLGDILLGGVSYSIDSLRMLRACYGFAKTPYMFIGNDVAERFTEWKEYEKIIEMVNIVILTRTITDREYSFPHQISFIDAVDTSSSEIRTELATTRQGHNLHPAVHTYIVRNSLYTV